MPTISDVVGAIMSDLTLARQLADRAAMEVAHSYQQEPLLKGMPIPRIRLPVAEIDLPLIVEDFEDETSEEVTSTDEITQKALESLTNWTQQADWDLRSADMDLFKSYLKGELDRIQPVLGKDVSVRQPFINASEQVLQNLVNNPATNFTPEIAHSLLPRLRDLVGNTAVAKPAKPPNIQVRVRTAEVKDQGTQATVTRLRLRLVEEGLEWHSFIDNDDSVKNQLIPE